MAPLRDTQAATTKHEACSPLSYLLFRRLRAAFSILTAFVLRPLIPVGEQLSDSQAKQAEDTEYEEQQSEHANDLFADIGQSIPGNISWIKSHHPHPGEDGA